MTLGRKKYRWEVYEPGTPDRQVMLPKWEIQGQPPQLVRVGESEITEKGESDWVVRVFRSEQRALSFFVVQMLTPHPRNPFTLQWRKVHDGYYARRKSKGASKKAVKKVRRVLPHASSKWNGSAEP